MAASQAALSVMPKVVVAHGGAGAGGSKDLRMENFSINVAGKDLVSDASVTLAFGRRYGLVGRNGTGKTTFLKHMALHAIAGIPKSTQILHVEQEVAGDDSSVLDCVLSVDSERASLLQEEARLTRQMEAGEGGGEGEGKEKEKGVVEGSTERLAQIYKRLELIDAYSAESRAASILAVGPEPQPQLRTRAF